MFKKLLTSLFATTAIAATLCAAGTTAFAATVVDPLAPGGNVMAQASATDPARITLQNTAEGNYLLAVEPWAYEVSSAEPLVATVDDNNAETPAVTKTLVSNAYMYGAYTAYFDLSPATTSLVITTGSATEIDLSVSLYAPVETTPLPVDANNPAILDQWTEYTYSYTPAASGYYTMHWGTNTTGAEFNVMEKVEPEYLSGTTVQDQSYPLYFVEGQEVYFSVMYTGGNEATTADVWFDFTAWEPTAIGFDERVYVPITPANIQEMIPFESSIEKNAEYLLRLNTEPVYPEGTVITAHIVDADKNELSTATSDFNNVYDITLPANAYGVYFTSTYTERFVGSVIMDITPSEPVNFTVGVNRTVTLKRSEALTCFLLDVPATGTYNITLSGLPAENSPVSVYDAYDTIVPAGETSGTFAVVMEYPNVYGFEGETTKNAALTFQNSSTTSITFSVLITKNTSDFNVELDTETKLSAPAHSKVVYYIPGLTGTLYGVKLTNSGANVRVYDYFDRYEPIVDADKPEGMYSFGDISFETVKTITYAFVVVNESDFNETITITFTELNALYLDKQTPVEVAKEENYYMLNVTTGRYMITLSDVPEGADFTVSYNEEAIVFDNEHVGYFNVEVPEGSTDTTVVLKVTNNIATPLTLTAVVTATADGTMTLGEPQEVTLGYNDASETYDIDLEANVEYRITVEGDIPENVTYYALVNGTYVLYTTNEATFTLTEDATSIQFGYFFFDAIYFTMTVTITAA